MRKSANVMWKLVAVLAVPVILLVVFAYQGASDRRAEAARAQRVVDLTRVVQAATSTLHEVEKEAFLAARFSGSQGNDPQIVEAYEKQQSATETSVSELRRQIDEVDPGSADPLVKGAIANLSSRLAGLADHRSTVAQRSTDGLAANIPYEHVTGALVDSIRQLANSLQDPVLFQRMSSVARIAGLGAARANSADLLAVAVEVGYFPAQPPKSGTAPSKNLGSLSEACGDNPSKARDESCKIYTDLIDAYAAADKAKSEFEQTASPSDLPVLRAQSNESPFNDLLASAIESGRLRNDLSSASLGASNTDFAAAAGTLVDGYESATRFILMGDGNPDAVATIARAQADHAEQEASRYLLTAVLAIAAAAVVTLLVGRSIARSLRRPEDGPPAEPVAASTTAD